MAIKFKILALINASLSDFTVFFFALKTNRNFCMEFRVRGFSRKD